MRMEAYYFAFDPTGNEAIDRILAAVASAGRACHHTRDWSESSGYTPGYLRGDTPVEWIQNAAIDAAAGVASPRCGKSIPAPAGYPELAPCQRNDGHSGDHSLLSEVEWRTREVRAALQAILADPHGCVFCDSGRLRNPEKDHRPECGYALAVKALGGAL